MDSQLSSNQPGVGRSVTHAKRIWGGLFLAGAIILIGLNFYAYYLRLSYREQGFRAHQVSEQELQDSRRQKQLSQPSPEDASNWKTFRSLEYGFEFKYPEEWEEQNPNSGGEYILLVELTSGKQNPAMAGLDGMIFNISPRAIEDEKKWIEGSSESGFFDFKSVTMGGRKLYVSQELQGTEGRYREALIELGPKTLVIIASPLNLNKFDQIISTFKFYK